MQKSGGPKRTVQFLGMGVLVAGLMLSMGTLASVSTADEPAGPTPSAVAPSGDTTGDTAEPAAPLALPPAQVGPYGPGYPVTLETDFSRPKKALSKNPANHDFSLLDDLERLIRGSYTNPVTGKLRPVKERTTNAVYISISQMPQSHRVGRELIKAARAGVQVRVIHGKATQSAASRALQKSINASKYQGKRTGYFHICQKGKSLACLSSLPGAIMHSKILYVASTYTRDKVPAKGAIWSGSANLGGRSGEQTYNNGLTIYNDQKLNNQIKALWADMWAERNVSNDYLGYVKKHKTRYGLSDAPAKGYVFNYAGYGMFYSNLANVTIYPTPIYATPSNGKDPVLMMLGRIIPDDTCRIYVQHNRFKYRRIAVAQKLVELSNAGCKVSAIAYKDDLASNRAAHCQLWIRICKPILDTFRTANIRIETAWARPHDKTMLVSAKMGPNKLNPEERQVNGEPFPAAGAHVKLVQAGSAALTGSNLIVSDEITTETTDPQVFQDYLEHWDAIWKSPEHADYAY